MICGRDFREHGDCESAFVDSPKNIKQEIMDRMIEDAKGNIPHGRVFEIRSTLDFPEMKGMWTCGWYWIESLIPHKNDLMRDFGPLFVCEADGGMVINDCYVVLARIENNGR
jgi:hypothetical protein